MPQPSGSPRKSESERIAMHANRLLDDARAIAQRNRRAAPRDPCRARTRAAHAPDPRQGPRRARRPAARMARRAIDHRAGRHAEGRSGTGRTVLLRGDMDALPMPEETGLDFASTIPGAMHACGHDAHTAMLAGAARLLCARRDSLQGEVRFMFQPGEEGLSRRALHARRWPAGGGSRCPTRPLRCM